MAPRPVDDDATIIMPRGRPPNRRQFMRPLLAGGGALALAAAAGGAWLTLRPAPTLALDVEDEAQIDQSAPCATKISYFSPDHAVVVLDFADLLTQGLMLDRVAALVEKAGVPRNRVLGDAELNQAITASGNTIESYYYGHDYQAPDLARFFALAEAESIRLNTQERWLKRLLGQLGWLQPGASGAIISVPAAGGPVAPDMRAVILHHEISHGAFYTNTAYRRYTEAFWYSLTEADRAAFTGFLGRQGYDTSNTELMLNETQAYLVFTPDQRFFNAAAVGKTDAEITELRTGFIAGLPDFWLTPLASAAPPAAVPAKAQCKQTVALLCSACARARLVCA